MRYPGVTREPVYAVTAGNLILIVLVGRRGETAIGVFRTVVPVEVHFFLDIVLAGWYNILTLGPGGVACR